MLSRWDYVLNTQFSCMVYIEYRIWVVITSPINLTGLDFYQKPFICKGKLHFYDLSNIISYFQVQLQCTSTKLPKNYKPTRALTRKNSSLSYWRPRRKNFFWLNWFTVIYIRENIVRHRQKINMVLTSLLIFNYSIHKHNKMFSHVKR